MQRAENHSPDADSGARTHAWTLFAPEGEGEMPNESLLEAARLAYPVNLFEFMPWISSEAHELIKPPDERVLRMVGFMEARHRLSVGDGLRVYLDLQPRVVETQIQDDLTYISSVLEAAGANRRVVELSADVAVEFVDEAAQESETDDMIEDIEDGEIVEPIDESDDQ